MIHQTGVAATDDGRFKEGNQLPCDVVVMVPTPETTTTPKAAVVTTTTAAVGVGPVPITTVSPSQCPTPIITTGVTVAAGGVPSNHNDPTNNNNNQQQQQQEQPEKQQQHPPPPPLEPLCAIVATSVENVVDDIHKNQQDDDDDDEEEEDGPFAWIQSGRKYNVYHGKDGVSQAKIRGRPYRRCRQRHCHHHPFHGDAAAVAATGVDKVALSTSKRCSSSGSGSGSSSTSSMASWQAPDDNDNNNDDREQSSSPPQQQQQDFWVVDVIWDWGRKEEHAVDCRRLINPHTLHRPIRLRTKRPRQKVQQQQQQPSPKKKTTLFAPVQSPQRRQRQRQQQQRRQPTAKPQAPRQRPMLVQVGVTDYSSSPSSMQGQVVTMTKKMNGNDLCRNRDLELNKEVVEEVDEKELDDHADEGEEEDEGDHDDNDDNNNNNNNEGGKREGPLTPFQQSLQALRKEKPDISILEAKFLLKLAGSPSFCVPTALLHLQRLEQEARQRKLPVPIPNGLRIQRRFYSDDDDDDDDKGQLYMGYVHHEYDELGFENGRYFRHWQIQYDDGDVDDMEYEEILRYRMDSVGGDIDSATNPPLPDEDEDDDDEEDEDDDQEMDDEDDQEQVDDEDDQEQVDDDDDKIVGSTQFQQSLRALREEKPNLLPAEAKYLLQLAGPPFYPVETALYHMDRLDHWARTRQLPIPIPIGLRIEKSFGEDGRKHVGHVHHEHDELGFENGRYFRQWEIHYDDGDKDDLEYEEILQFQATDRNDSSSSSLPLTMQSHVQQQQEPPHAQPHGRPLHCLELFCGRSPLYSDSCLIMCVCVSTREDDMCCIHTALSILFQELFIVLT